jgi:hypothetical protein
MTTRKTKDGRLTRSPSAKTGPDRSPALTRTKAAPKTAKPAEAKPAPKEKPHQLSDAAAHAVKRAYKVIGENIEQGRAAAEQFREGHYNIRDVPYDLNEMSLRVLGLTRELSVVTFTLLERLLTDPKFPGGGIRPTGKPGRKPTTPGGFRPAPPPPGQPSPGPASSQAGSAQVRVDVLFVGKPGKVLAVALARPDSAPAFADLRLTAAGVPKAPPIVGDPVWRADDPGAAVITLTLAKDQPAGVYGGLIRAGDTGLPLGVITIEVGP